MGTPFLGEIKIISWNYAPKGWAFANGQLMQINQNQALFSLFGTTYGGDGRVTFALPNLQGKLPLGTGNGFTIGQVGGEYNHTLNLNELPQHNHFMTVSMANAFVGSTGRNPGGNLPAAALAAPSPGTPVKIWGTGSATMQFSPTTISPVGGSQPHTNTQPYLTLNFIVALQGAFPSQN